MRGVAGQHHPAAFGRHPDRLDAAGVPADQMQRDPRRDLLRAIVDFQPFGIERVDRGPHVFHIVWAAEERFAHAGAGAIAHFRGLDMERRLGEILHAAGMIPVHVRQHHVRRRGRIDAGIEQRLGRRAQNLPPATSPGFRAETGVHHDGAAVAADGKQEKIHRVRGGMVIHRDDEILKMLAVVHQRVAQGQHFVGGFHGGFLRSIDQE